LHVLRGRPCNQPVADTRVTCTTSAKRTAREGESVPLLRHIDTFGRSAVIS